MLPKVEFNFKIKYLVSFFLMGFVVLTSAILIELDLLQQIQDSRVINIAGRQRMLSQKISKIATKLQSVIFSEEKDLILQKLDDSLVLWEKSENALRFGDPDFEISAGNNSPVIEKMYENLEFEHSAMLSAGKEILEAYKNEPYPNISVPLLMILNNEASFLEKMDAVVFQYDYEAREKVKKTRATVFFASLAILLFLFFLWFFVISPSLKRSEEINKAKTEFVSLASHQLQAPLSSIKWGLEVLLSGEFGKMNKKQTEYLESIFVSSKNMSKLVIHLLNVSRLDMGTFSVNSTQTNVASLARDVIAEQKFEFNRKKIDFKLNVVGKVPTVKLDKNLLKIVLQNLLSNSVKYTPEKGKIAMEISSRGGKLIISVSDTGYGIPKNQQDKIFNRLFRAENIKKHDVVGSGLGLYMVKSILDNTGGKIWFKSKENTGSTFNISYPLSGMESKDGSKTLVFKDEY